MSLIHLAALAALWSAGVHAENAPDMYAQERPDPPRPPRAPDKDSQERREQIERLEAEIRELEGVLKNDDVPAERRDAAKKRLSEKYAQLKELRGGDPGWWKEPKGDGGEKMRRLEMRIHELETALQKKEMGPEDRKEMTGELHRARAQLDELRMHMRQDPLGKGQGMFGGPGPMDPESQKLHMAAQELDRASIDLAAKLRGVPKDAKDDRAAVISKLKETVVQLFDLRERIRAREVEMIKRRLEELTQMLEKRKSNRDAIIEKRVKQLSGESDDLDW